MGIKINRTCDRGPRQRQSVKIRNVLARLVLQFRLRMVLDRRSDVKQCIQGLILPPLLMVLALGARIDAETTLQDLARLGATERVVPLAMDRLERQQIADESLHARDRDFAGVTPGMFCRHGQNFDAESSGVCARTMNFQRHREAIGPPRLPGQDVRPSTSMTWGAFSGCGRPLEFGVLQ